MPKLTLNYPFLTKVWLNHRERYIFIILTPIFFKFFTHFTKLHNFAYIIIMYSPKYNFYLRYYHLSKLIPAHITDYMKNK